MERLSTSRKMAIAAILLCTIATIIALFPDSMAEPLTLPLLFIGIGLWLLSVVWFLWGWLSNQDNEGNERRGVSASSYILAFLPLCYCYLLATDEARTKVEVVIHNESSVNIDHIKVYGTGTIFLKPDTLKLLGLAPNDKATYTVKASTSPHMKGAVQMEASIKGKWVSREIAGPFSINPMNLKQDWKVEIDDAFFEP